MAEYYVVRDKNTGLYFRGKGVNRWGKYYNQAPIYRIKANAENTIKEVSWRGEQAEIVPIQIVETTEDVVPKSEVESTNPIQEAIEQKKKENKGFALGFLNELLDEKDAEIKQLKIENEALRTSANAYKMHYENAKQEVAREIFEELEEVLCEIGYFDEIDFRSLKKKYTKEGE